MNVFLDLALLCCSVALPLQMFLNKKQAAINKAVQEQVLGLVDALKTVVLTLDDKSLEQALRLQGAAGEKK